MLKKTCVNNLGLYGSLEVARCRCDYKKKTVNNRLPIVVKVMSAQLIISNSSHSRCAYVHDVNYNVINTEKVIILSTMTENGEINIPYHYMCAI